MWNLGRGEKGYGTDKYPGKLPAQQIKNLLWFYTNEGDMVLDPFAGGGTTLDVCNEWKRKCYASDINPCRPDIVKRDIVVDKLPDIRAKLIILDPPYAGQKKGHYTDEPTDLSNMTIPKFYSTMKDVATDCYDHILYNGRVMLVVSQSRVDGVVHDLPFELYKRFTEVGFVLEERMSIPYEGAASMSAGFWWKSAIKHGYMLRAYKDQFIFIRKDFDPKSEKFTKTPIAFNVADWFI